MEGNTEFQEPTGGSKSGTQVLERAGVNVEVKERLPKVKLEVRLAKHGSFEDAEGLEERFNKCDIFFPETFGWLPRQLDALQKLSFGSITPGIALQRWDYRDEHSLTRDQKFFQMVYRSKKPIAFLDVPDGHPLVKRENENKFPNINFGSDFSQILNSVREYIKEEGRIHAEREAYMVRQLKPQIQKILEDHPELKNKSEIAVLIDIGSGHKFLPGRLREEYDTTVFDKDETFLYSEEGRIKYMKSLGSDARERTSVEILDDDLIARIVAEWGLLKEHPDVFQTANSESKAIELKKRISRYTFAELREEFGKAKSRKEWADLLMREAKKGASVTAGVT